MIYVLAATFFSTPIVLNYFLWTIVFGALLLLWVLGNSGTEQHWRSGLKWALESEGALALGESAFLVYMLQFPLATIFYWSEPPLRSGVART